MGIISWIVFGALAGWVASMVVGKNQGCATNIIVGVIGAFVGGLLMDVLFNRSVSFDWNLNSFGVAVLGAVVFLVVLNMIQRRS